MSLTLSAWLSNAPPPQISAEPPPATPQNTQAPHAWAAHEPDAQQHVRAGAPSPTQAPPLALIATTPNSDQSTLHIVTPGQKWPAPTVTFTHVPGASVRGAAFHKRPTIMATARNEERRDASFDMGLYRLDPDTGATLLCGDVIHASRPLITPDDRVFVARGSAGSAPTAPGTLRVDVLHIDEIDPQHGTAHKLYDYEGYLLHLAGYHQGELLIYRVGPDHADLIALDPNHTKTRVLVPNMLPFARDFSVDALHGRLIYRQRHDSDETRWTVMAADLTSGARQLLYEGERFSLTPHAWPDGGIAFNPRGSGLRLLGSADHIAAPLGHGVDQIRAVSPDGQHIAALHSRQGMLPVAFSIDRTTSGTIPIHAPPHQRIAIAGFVSAEAWGSSTQEGTP